jgi:X-Pro dipeptidyl-peptidase
VINTLHRWFDHSLHGIENGITREPKVDVERPVGVWEQHHDWPIPGTTQVTTWFRAGAEGAGTLALTPATGAPQTQSFVDDPNQFESQMINNPTEPSENRLVFLSEPLEDDLRISGTAGIKLKASSSLDEAFFGAIIVDYGPSIQNSRSGDGILQTTLPEECYGESNQYDDGCYRPIAYRPTEVTEWRVTKGILDGQNRNSIAVAESMVPGEMYNITFPLLPNDHVFAAGNRIGVVVVGSYRSYSASRISRGRRSQSMRRSAESPCRS